MSRNFRKTIVLVIAVVFALAPVAFAQTSRPGGTGQTESGSPATGAPGMSSQPGTMGAQDAIPATVADVDQQRNTVKLKMQSGETVELKVPERSLTTLQKGDSVQVSIRKANGSQPGMGGSMSPSRPDASTPGTSPSGSGTPGTKSR